MYLGFLDCPIGGWVQQYGGWTNPTLSGHLFRLLLSSWQQDPCASIPDDDQWLSEACGMDLPAFQKIKADLLNGFMLVGVRWISPELQEKARALEIHHGESIARLQASITAVTLDPDNFSLHSYSGPDERRRRRRIPEGFSISAALAEWGVDYLRRACAAQGATQVPGESECHAVLISILETFRADAKSNSRLHEDWDAAFRLFATRQTNGEFGLCVKYLPSLFPLRITPVSNGMQPSSRFGGGLTRREMLNKNSDDALAELLSEKSVVVDVEETVMRATG